MAQVIRFSTVIRQEVHGVVLGNVFWVQAHEFCEMGQLPFPGRKRIELSPFTVAHNVSIVGPHSYNEMVKL